MGPIYGRYVAPMFDGKQTYHIVVDKFGHLPDEERPTGPDIAQIVHTQKIRSPWTDRFYHMTGIGRDLVSLIVGQIPRRRWYVFVHAFVPNISNGGGRGSVGGVRIQQKPVRVQLWECFWKLVHNQSGKKCFVCHELARLLQIVTVQGWQTVGTFQFLY